MTGGVHETTNQEPDASLADQLGELLRLVRHSNVEELDVQHQGTRFVIRRDLSGDRVATHTDVDQPVLPRLPESYVITSPLVGVFHRANGTVSEPAIDAGSHVTVGQVVGAVEAMRMLNRVQSERAGIVQEVLVREGQPVEYGQPLLVLREP